MGHSSLLTEWREFEPMQKQVEQIILESYVRSSKIFHSTDLGASWTEITHGNESLFMNELSMTILANTGETRLSQGVVPVDKNIFYRASPSGIHRTTDGGKSWQPFMKGIMETTIQDLAAHNNRLYAYTGKDLVQSADGGETWETVRIDSDNQILEGIEQKLSHLNLALQLAIANDTLYGIAPESGTDPEKDSLRLFQLPAGDNVLVPIPGAPTFERESSFVELWTGERLPNNPEKWERSDNLQNTSHFLGKSQDIGGFAATGQTFYVEWKRQLFKWKHGDSEWTDTGLIDNSEPLGGFDKGFKLAVSADTVYVGKRDGQLFQSLDGGNSWKDITPILPLRFTRFNAIVFAGKTVYVATDEGVLASQSGEHWRVITDETGVRIVIDTFATDNASVYGAGKSVLYRLDDRRRWKQIAPSVPDKVLSLAVSNDRLYIATQRRGIFHISLEEGL